MNFRTRTRPICFILFALAGAFWLSQPANAQSESDLRKDNESLRNELRNAQLELDSANKRIRELEAQIDQLRAALAAGGGSRPATPLPDLPEEPVSIDESVANASPRALFNALKASYAEAVKNQKSGTAKPGDKERGLYLRTVEQWTERVNRELKDKINWHVRIDETMRDPSTSQHLARLIAVDPKTGTELGDGFVVRIDRPTAMRLQRVERYADVSVLVLSGVLQPQVKVNAERSEPGPFDKDLIGPFAEFGFAVEVMSLVPPEKEKPVEEPKPAESANPESTAGAEKP
jgi:hypothetical protein